MIRAILAAGALACLTLAGAAEPAGAAAVALSRDKAGNETFFIFGTGRTGALENLPAELKKSGCREADLSAWTNAIDYGKLLASLSEAGIRVPRCYVPEPGKAAHFRKNLAGPEPEESGERSVVFVRALIEDNEYNRRHKLPGPFKRVKYITIHNTAEPFRRGRNATGSISGATG